MVARWSRDGGAFGVLCGVLGGMRRFGVRRNVLGYDGVLECDAVVWSATRHAASLQTPARANTTMRDITTGMGGIRQDARIWWTCGRGNLRENCEDPAPTVGIAGRRLRSMPHRPSFMPMRASTGRRKGKSRRGVPRRCKNHGLMVGCGVTWYAHAHMGEGRL